MEFEFDKEIDAILRKARDSEFVFANNPKSVHLDADEIAAFAENALPEKSKTLYTKHFADCDRCRRILSNLIALNTETATVSVSSNATELISATPTPWYRKLFVMPNLAYTMGAFVLVFGGFLGVLVLQNFNNQQNTLSQATDTQQKESGPSYNQDTGFSAANTNSAMSNATTANAASNTATTAANSNAKTSNTATAVSNQSSTNSAAIAREPETLAKEKSTVNQPTVFATPPPVAQGQTARSQENKDDRELSKQSEIADDVASAAPPPPAPITRMEAPKASKKVQASEPKLSATRDSAVANKKIGGKTFERRNAAWVDTEYREDIMLRHISRGSNDYKKLDSGLKNIAENLGGVVIVVWKSKGYRIQ